ncbi:MAG: hypothetical protein FJ276_28635 [Planctomycetes bacterium]|nr:hypothetical protein [Planctomycetota bacterium]
MKIAQFAKTEADSISTEWSLVHMLRVLRSAILENTINAKSATKAELHQLLDDLDNYLALAH